MKKIYLGALVGSIIISGGIALAEETASSTKPLPPKPKKMMEVVRGEQGQPSDEMGQMMEKMVPRITTGDKAKDEQIKALHKEMIDKIKALRDEYQAKIKAIAGDSKPVIIKKDGSTTTPREVMENRMEKREMMRQGGVKGEATSTMMEDMGQAVPKTEGRIFDFFRGLFGR